MGESEVKKSDRLDPTLARAMASSKRMGHLMQPFLEEYEKTENETLASKTVGISGTTAARWKKNEDFMTLFTAAHLRAQKKNNDNLKASALQRAINGTIRYAVANGKILKDDNNQPVIYRDFETALTMFMLKNRLPEEFKDKFEYEISGQLIVALASEFIAIVRRNAPIEISNAIAKELETLSAKMTAA